MSRLRLVVNEAGRSLAGMFPGFFGLAKHNHYKDFGFPENPAFADFLRIYERNGLATAAVDKTVAKTWQTAPFLLERERDSGSDAKETTLERDIRERFGDLRVWQHLAEADRRSMVGAYAGVILRFADSKGLNEPVDRVTGGLAGLVEIIPAWEAQLTVSEWDDDQRSESYGLPKMFSFNESAVGGASSKPRTAQIHPDRVIVWSKDGTVHGRSALKPGFNDLLTLEKIIGAGGEGFWKNAKSSPVLEIDKEASVEAMARAMGIKPEDVADKMGEQVEAWQKGFDELLMLQGMTAKSLGVTLPSPEHFFSVAVQSFAASMSIPLKILVGNQTGERASSEDAADWAQTNMGRRSNHVVPNIRLLVARLERVGILPVKDWHIDWTDLTEASMAEKIERANKMADVNQKMKDTGEFVFTPEEIRGAVGLEPLAEGEKYRETEDEDDEAAAAGGAVANSGGGRAASVPFVDNGRRRKPGGGGQGRSYNPLQPRGGDGRWVPTGKRIERAAELIGQNVAHHERLFGIRRPAAMSKIIGVDVRGLQHAVSNQSLTHALKNHGNPVREAARGQKALTRDDFANIPTILKAGSYHKPTGRPGSSEIEIRAKIGPDEYVYQARVRKGPGRLDMVTMWKK